MAEKQVQTGQRPAMPAAQLKTPWLVLAWCCCIIMRAQAIRDSNASREEYSPIIRTDAREDFILSRMLFTYTEPEPRITRTTLKMCSETALSNAPVDPVVTVVFGTPDTQEYSVEGALVDGGLCAEFVMAYLVPETTEPITYTLVVDEEGTLKTSTVVFALTVVVTVLSCDHKNLSRVSWTTSTALEGDCMPFSGIPENFCYREADLSDQEVCFKTEGNADTVVCRKGGVVVASDPSQISVNYLSYDPASPDPASLSLLFNDDSEKSLEVTLWSDSNVLSVLSCDAACTVTPFASSNAVYEACAFLTKGVLRGPQSGFASVQDVKLVAYDTGEVPLAIEYFFLNSNTATRLYVVSLLTGPSPDQLVATIHQDCLGVAVGHTCFGRIATASLASSADAYLSVQYTDETFESPTNRVAAKVQLLPNRGRNFSSPRDTVNSVKGNKGYSTPDS